MMEVKANISATVATWLIGLGVSATKKGKAIMEKKRIEDVLKLAGTDKNAVKLVEDVLKASMNYLEACFTMETTVALQMNRLEGEELRTMKERLDSNRRIRHNTLLDAIKIANRYLFRTFGKAVPTGGVYSADPIHLAEMNTYRAAIGDWAGRLIMAFYNERQR